MTMSLRFKNFLALTTPALCLALGGCVLTVNGEGDTDDDDAATDDAATDDAATDDAATDDAATDDAATDDAATAGETEEGGTDSSEDTGSDTTGGSPLCGWGPTGIEDPSEGYVCGGTGEDPLEEFPYACPEDLTEGDPCGTVEGEGCCDADGNSWYCGLNELEELVLVQVDCSAP